MMNRDEVLERYYLDCRCMLLELAATLDRHDRAPSASGRDAAVDDRLLRLRQSIEILAAPGHQPDRAARLLQLLSHPVG